MCLVLFFSEWFVFLTKYSVNAVSMIARKVELLLEMFNSDVNLILLLMYLKLLFLSIYQLKIFVKINFKILINC